MARWIPLLLWATSVGLTAALLLNGRREPAGDAGTAVRPGAAAADGGAAESASGPDPEYPHPEPQLTISGGRADPNEPIEFIGRLRFGRGPCIESDRSIEMPIVEIFAVEKVVCGRLRVPEILVRPTSPVSPRYPRGLPEGAARVLRLVPSKETVQRLWRTELSGIGGIWVDKAEVEDGEMGAESAAKGVADDGPFVFRARFYKGDPICVPEPNGDTVRIATDGFEVVEVLAGSLRTRRVEVRPGPLGGWGDAYPPKRESGKIYTLRLTPSEHTKRQLRERDDWVTVSQGELAEVRP